MWGSCLWLHFELKEDSTGKVSFKVRKGSPIMEHLVPAVAAYNSQGVHPCLQYHDLHPFAPLGKANWESYAVTVLTQRQEQQLEKHGSSLKVKAPLAGHAMQPCSKLLNHPRHLCLRVLSISSGIADGQHLFLRGPVDHWQQGMEISANANGTWCLEFVQNLGQKRKQAKTCCAIS